MTRTLVPGATALVLIATSSLCLAQAPAEPAEAPPADPAAAPPAPEAAADSAAPGPVEQPPVEAPAAEPAAPAAPAPEAPAPPPEPAPAVATQSTAEVGIEAEATASTDVELDAGGAASGSSSWFARPPVAVKFGEGDRATTLTFYGLIEADYVYDTTRSYNDTIGSTLVARGDTYEGTVGRTQFSMRRSRLGLTFESPEMGGLRPYARVEGDFTGNQPTNTVGASEASFYDSPGFLLRYGYLKLGSDVVDVTIGQTDDLFGWQETFNQLSRHTQLRISKNFGGDTAPVSVDVAAAAVRPVQRDAQVPDTHAGVRLNINNWKGIATPRGIPRSRPMSVGVSGVVRQFDLDAFTPPPTQTSNKVTGWGVAVDLLVPVIAADDVFDRGNKLTLLGSFYMGTGIGDLIFQNGGAKFPPLPNPARTSPAPEYDANIDEGIVTFDRLGVLNTIDWQVIRAGVRYFLPPSGRVFLEANYIQGYSKNMEDLYPQGGAEIELLTHVADRTRYVDAKLFWDVTNAVRLGLEGAYTQTQYLDGEEPDNLRGKFIGMYFF